MQEAANDKPDVPVWPSRRSRRYQPVRSRPWASRQRIRDGHQAIRGIGVNVHPAGPRATVEAVAGLHSVRLIRHGGETQDKFTAGLAAKHDGMDPEIALWIRRVGARIQLIAIIHAVTVAVDAQALAGAPGDESERDFAAGACKAD